MKLDQKDLRPAFTVVELLIAIACLMFAAVMLLPYLRPARHRVKAISCTNHLKQVGLAFKTWALDNNDHFPALVSVTNGGTMELVQSGDAYIHFQAISNELSSTAVLVCQTDTSRVAAASFKLLRNTNLSYFYCPDAADSSPNGFLAGDDNLTVNGVAPGHGPALIATNSTMGWMASRHGIWGNIGLADGSVQQWNGTKLTEALGAGGSPTLRLLMP